MAVSSFVSYVAGLSVTQINRLRRKLRARRWDSPTEKVLRQLEIAFRLDRDPRDPMYGLDNF